MLKVRIVLPVSKFTIARYKSNKLRFLDPHLRIGGADKKGFKDA